MVVASLLGLALTPGRLAIWQPQTASLVLHQMVGTIGSSLRAQVQATVHLQGNLTGTSDPSRSALSPNNRFLGSLTRRRGDTSTQLLVMDLSRMQTVATVKAKGVLLDWSPDSTMIVVREVLPAGKQYRAVVIHVPTRSTYNLGAISGGIWRSDNFYETWGIGHQSLTFRNRKWKCSKESRQEQQRLLGKDPLLRWLSSNELRQVSDHDMTFTRGPSSLILLSLDRGWGTPGRLEYSGFEPGTKGRLQQEVVITRSGRHPLPQRSWLSDSKPYATFDGQGDLFMCFPGPAFCRDPREKNLDFDAYLYRFRSNEQFRKPQFTPVSGGSQGWFLPNFSG